MLNYRVVSTRVENGHQAQNFSNSLKVSTDWGKGEQERGHLAVLYQVVENELMRWAPPVDVVALNKNAEMKILRCSHGHLFASGKDSCGVCGELR